MQRIIVGVLLAGAFVAALITVTLQQSGVECEVCLTFNGRSMCETAAAPDRSDAQMQATSSICSQLSGGVTQGIQCSNTRPTSVRCVE